LPRRDDAQVVQDGPSRLVGYARISTDDQTTALQADALARAAVDVVFEEAASGADTARPVLAKTLAALRPGDTLVVWRLDRLGRSLGHLIEVATVLRERGIFLRSLTEGFDTSTASGRLLYHVLGAVAEFEREVIKERTVAGMKAAKKRGTHVGRPQALVGSRLAEAVAGDDSTGVPRRKRQALKPRLALAAYRALYSEFSDLRSNGPSRHVCGETPDGGW
jgi:DNA invertase Pin-like site-specific DNA recombinase